MAENVTADIYLLAAYTVLSLGGYNWATLTATLSEFTVHLRYRQLQGKMSASAGQEHVGGMEPSWTAPWSRRTEQQALGLRGVMNTPLNKSHSGQRG